MQGQECFPQAIYLETITVLLEFSHHRVKEKKF